MRVGIPFERKKTHFEKQNLNFLFGKKKKKKRVCKIFNLETSFLKCVFNKKVWLKNRLLNIP